MDGQWTESFVIRDGGTKREIENCRCETSSTSSLIIAPLEHQGPRESRKAWRKVAMGIEQGDMGMVSAEKSKVKKKQRKIRKKE